VAAEQRILDDPEIDRTDETITPPNEGIVMNFSLTIVLVLVLSISTTLVLLYFFYKYLGILLRIKL